MRIKVSPNALSEHLLGELKGLLGEHPGESQVFLHLGERQIVRLPDEFNVDAVDRPRGRAAGAARTRRHRRLSGRRRSDDRGAELHNLAATAGLEGSVPWASQV